MGFPIRKSADQRLFAPPHGLSQRTTSFIASQRQGIHRIPLLHLIALIIDAHHTSLTSAEEDALARPFHPEETGKDSILKTSFASNISGNGGQAAFTCWMLVANGSGKALRPHMIRSQQPDIFTLYDVRYLRDRSVTSCEALCKDERRRSSRVCAQWRLRSTNRRTTQR